MSLGKPRPVLPKEWTYRVFQAIHSLAHAGPRPTQRAIADRYVWHGLKRDIRRWCRECQSCQAAKVHRHIRAPLSHRSQPTGRFHSIHVDLVGPLPPSEGMTYLFTIIDRFTRWPEVIPLPDAKTPTCTNALIRGWISRFGVPADITSDRGPQFTSSLWSNLNKMLGIANPSGWMSAACFTEFIKHFIKHTKCSKDRPAILILDNRDSHISIEIIDLSKENGVTLVTLPPHCSHKLQPLN